MSLCRTSSLRCRHRTCRFVAHRPRRVDRRSELVEKATRHCVACVVLSSLCRFVARRSKTRRTTHDISQTGPRTTQKLQTLYIQYSKNINIRLIFHIFLNLKSCSNQNVHVTLQHRSLIGQFP